MTCPTCKHSDKKNPEAVHVVGECPQCNCGVSDIVHRASMAGHYISSVDQYGRSDAGEGRYRVFEAPTQR